MGWDIKKMPGEKSADDRVTIGANEEINSRRGFLDPPVSMRYPS